MNGSGIFLEVNRIGLDGDDLKTGGGQCRLLEAAWVSGGSC